MADSGDGEFPILHPSMLSQNHPLFTDEILSFMAEIKPTLAELMAKSAQVSTSNVNPTVLPVPQPSYEEPGEADSSATPMQADDTQGIESCTQPNVDWSFEAGPSNYLPEDQGGDRREQGNFDPQNPGGAGGGDGGGGSGGGYNRPLSIVPVIHVVPPITCSCCQVLREIIHTNGVNTRKLQIHGRFGIFGHAIFHESFTRTSDDVDPISSGSQYQLFDFAKKSTDEVKQFIMQYYLNQMIDEYIVLPEPLSDFYDVLCVGLDWGDQNSFNIDPQQAAPLHTVEEEGYEEGEGECEGQEFEEGEEEMEIGQQQEIPDERQRDSRTPLAKQRQRTGKLTVNDFRDYLHLPISEAAKKMNLCLTVVKKICRRSGLRRWPYRKVKSYQRKMGALGASLRSRDAETRAKAEAEMERLRQELAQFCAGIVLD